MYKYRHRSCTEFIFKIFFSFTGDSTNKFVNENWKEIIQEVNPLIEDTLGEIMLQMTKGLLDLYALEDLIPE